MKYVGPFVFAVAAGSLVGATLVSASDRPRLEAARPPAAQSEEHPGAALLVRICNGCHDSARIVETRRTKDDWQNVMLKMIELGAGGDERELETLFAYLCFNHGLVFINHAPAPEIAMTLGLSDKDAGAIVAHRAKAGAFADLEALKKVPGVDVKKIEEKKNAILF
jgi:competence ComEA-like helix-hairpin-helix protein